MSGVNLERLIYDPADPLSPNVGAYLRASDGTHLTHTDIGGKKALDVNVLTGVDDGVYAEDAVAADGAMGVSVFKVRQDTLSTLVSGTGDYEWFKGDARGALWVAPVGSAADDAADTEWPIKVGSKSMATLAAVSDGDRANMVSDLYRRVLMNDSAMIASLGTAVDVDDSATVLPAAALAGRKEILIQNKSNVSLFIGGSGVTTANGMELSKGATMSVKAGDKCLVYAIAALPGPYEVRVLEIA